MAKEMRSGGKPAPAIDDDEPWEDMILEGVYGDPDHDYAGRSFAAIEEEMGAPLTPDEAREILARIDELDLYIESSQRNHLERRLNGVESAR